MATITEIALMLSAAVLGIAALWHFYWAFGGTKGLAVAVPEKPAAPGNEGTGGEGTGGGPLFVPSTLSTVIAATAIASIAALYAAMATGVFNGTAYSRLAALATGVLGLVFIVRAIGDFNHVGFFKRNTGSPFAVADSRYYSPLCLFLGASGLMAAATRYL
jgi:hypothetical protein